MCYLFSSEVSLCAPAVMRHAQLYLYFQVDLCVGRHGWRLPATQDQDHNTQPNEGDMAGRPPPPSVASNVTEVYPIPGCKLALKSTQLDNVYLAELTSPEMQNIMYGVPQMPTREVDMQRNTAVAFDYTAYQLSWQLVTAGSKLCSKQHDTLDSTVVMI